MALRQFASILLLVSAAVTEAAADNSGNGNGNGNIGSGFGNGFGNGSRYSGTGNGNENGPLVPRVDGMAFPFLIPHHAFPLMEPLPDHGLDHSLQQQLWDMMRRHGSQLPRDPSNGTVE